MGEQGWGLRRGQADRDTEGWKTMEENLLENVVGDTLKGRGFRTDYLYVRELDIL